MCFWSCVLSLSQGVYNTKVVVYVPNRYPPNSARPQGQGIGLEGPGRPMSGYLNILYVIILNLTFQYYFINLI